MLFRSVGTGTSHDLVLAATDEMPRILLRRLVTAVARMLDVAASKRPITLIYLGTMTTADKADIERFARVLIVPSLSPTRAEIKSAVAVLLKLELPNAVLRGRKPMEEVLRTLGAATLEHERLLDAASGGAEHVREELRKFVNEAADVQRGS